MLYLFGGSIGHKRGKIPLVGRVVKIEKKDKKK
jgi:hypothetical protein